jgi:hypothetical protein
MSLTAGQFEGGMQLICGFKKIRVSPRHARTAREPIRAVNVATYPLCIAHQSSRRRGAGVECKPKDANEAAAICARLAVYLSRSQ